MAGKKMIKNQNFGARSPRPPRHDFKDYRREVWGDVVPRIVITNGVLTHADPSMNLEAAQKMVREGRLDEMRHFWTDHQPIVNHRLRKLKEVKQ